MACKGIHAKYADTSSNSNHYIRNIKRCTTCGIKIKWDGIRCPCCGYRLRTKPHKAVSKRVYLEMKKKEAEDGVQG